jgi:hypothetical protein
VSLFTPGPPVLAGVDELLRVVTTEALKGVASPVGVTVGPLDRPGDGGRQAPADKELSTATSGNVAGAP